MFLEAEDHAHLPAGIGDARLCDVRRSFHSQPVTGALVLVDDVYTTGATADAAAAALRRAGAAQIDVVTFARTIRRP